MDKDIYERWWKVHLRAASGEKLSPEEESGYQEWQETLDREETDSLLTASADDLVVMKMEIVNLQLTHNQLQLKSTRLDSELVQLEQTYRNVMRRELAGKMYARA